MATAQAGELSIAYDDHGAGEPALLCMPGWCAPRTAFDLLPAALPGRRVLALDWRGHGDSSLGSGDFGRAELLEDALAVIAASGARAIVPVSTAHAGWVAIALRHRLGPERVPKLVLVDWIVGPAPPPFLDALAALQDPARWQGARDRLFEMWTAGVSAQPVLDFVRQGMGRYGGEMWARGGREIAAAYGIEGAPLDALARLAPPPPTLHLYARPPDPAITAAQLAFASAHPWFQSLELDLRSHFPTLEAPTQVGAAITRFLEAA
jgi:pimeloyl-ACP methyl ester carboxylesterase